MPRPRHLLPYCLSLLLLVACTAQGARVDQSPQHGVLGDGASMSGRDAEGARWSLALVEGDVRLAVGGAVVLFEGGAPAGRLRFRHEPEEELWELELPFGTVRCRGSELVVTGVTHELESGVTYRFDASGRRIAPRAE